MPADVPAIEGVGIHPLQAIADDRGAVLHMLRADAEHFDRFGEIYFSTVHPGRVKAWQRHRRMTLNYAVPVGQIRFVIFDDREDSATRGRLMELSIGESNYCLVIVPSGLWSGFKGLGDRTALVANCATLPHDPAEIERRAQDTPTIPYDWSR